MSTDLYTRLLELLPSQPILIAAVQALHAGDMATVQLQGGALLRVRNPLAAPVGQAVYIQADAIVGDAPALDVVYIEI